MRLILLAVALLGVVALGIAVPIAAEKSPLRIGMITYWGSEAEAYGIVPDNSLAVINPDNGILRSRGQSFDLAKNIPAYRAVVKHVRKRNISMLGYVPTGYFNHECNAIGKCQTWERIEKQVEQYFKHMPEIKGIFFDEAAPSNWSCEAFVGEYARLREIVKAQRSTAQIVFNAGLPDNCVVSGVESGEIAVLFEGTAKNYFAQTERLAFSSESARKKGVNIWHLVHTVESNEQIVELVGAARKFGADYFYVTRKSGDWEAGVNTWGR